MSIGDAIITTGCLAGFMAALPAFLVFLSMVFDRTTFIAAERLRRGSVLPFFVGGVALALLALPLAGLSALGSVFQLMGVIGFFLLFMLAFTGLAAVARLLGMRITATYERNINPLVEMVGGAVVLAFAIAFPVIGWFLVLPLGLIIGSGAMFLTLFGRRRIPTDARPVMKADPTPAYYPDTTLVS